MAYHGELSEFDVLGTAPSNETSQVNIAKVLESASTPKLKRGDKVLLIQSGAIVPDNEMIEAISPYFSAGPFSGVPQRENQSDLSGSLRLRAAQGGYHYLLCYWGVLESAQEDREGKIVSWVPIAGQFVPDQREEMRIRLKAILLDVATGNWRMVTPEVHGDSGLNSHVFRASSDQKLVLDLKKKGYASLVSSLLAE